jgi:ribonucleoside-diphosphate reductase alpha chain
MSPVVEAPVKPGLKGIRFFTTKDVDPFDAVAWVKRDAVLIGADGSEKFRQNDIEVPAFWSERATNIVAEKYFRVIKGVKETSVKQMIRRISMAIADAACLQGIYPAAEDAFAFEAELRYMLLHQMFAFNSPVWFNVGVARKPQASACFIQSVEDTMESITALAQKEIRLFKGGSGTGSNLSPLRSSYEKLKGGGYASGPVSFMEMYDAGAGVTKSGGTTRRAAKMVMLNADHPDILVQQNGRPGFITCKSSAEQLARDLFSTGKYSAEFNVPGNIYERVGFQNANNSVRATDEFMYAVEKDAEWCTKKVTTGEVLHTYKAKGLFDEIVKAAWECGDPGMQFDTTINDWHTCPNTGKINGSNPCSEFMFLDDTACNLGSFNLMKFHSDATIGFDLNGFTHACEVATTSMEVLVDLAGYPGEEIGKNSHDYRPLGLGYANLGALLMVSGLAYDSPKGRALAAAITAIMSGVAYKQSARIAGVTGAFPGYAGNAEAMLRVIQKHSKAVDKIDDEGLKEYIHLAIDQWSEALELGKKDGFRNAQISVLAPTGTISFLMDCDTTGVEPALALVQYKKLVGGGQMKMANRLVSKALTTLGYSTRVITSLEKCIAETGDVVGCEGLKPKDRDVFATAIGTNAITPMGHLKMMAAVQPFISGAISKTVNLPSSATLEDVNRVYVAAWQMGLKAVAIYRDGCKLSQPAGTKVDGLGKSLPEAPPAPLWGDRKRMPTTRQSVTHKMQIGEHEGYVTVGLHEDGTPGEVFITMAQEGSALRGFMDLAATSISLGLQHGVPLEVLAHKMQGLKFEPSGFTQNPAIRMAQSIPDYIGRWLEQQFLKGEPTEETAELTEEVLHKEVVTQGYSGPPCSKCANLTVRSGTCFVCTQCGTTTGCG